MTADLASKADHEERLNELLLSYLEALQAGRPCDRSQILSANPELRADLEAFFASHDAVERLAAPLRTVSKDATEGHADIGLLGDFLLLRVVGRGGMGVVYEAEQISLRRRVALKMLPFAAAIDARQLARFKNEAMAAAHLRHENIVPVYAVGCERGVHFYAMQFIDGQSLAELIAERRRSQGIGEEGSSNGGRSPNAADQPTVDGRAGDRQTTPLDARSSLLDPRASFFRTAATLGRQAAEALDHAHGLGIIHRDIKPGNLLLDVRGQLWVADFGLAQVSGDAGVTVTGEMLGTLRYASPEQALARRGVVDHRSDIYSLGATLYELLTLRPLFAGRDRNELLRQIANDDPMPPRSLAPIPAELETIVLKALRKEPAERYASAADLADDLQRFLDNRPILARRPSVVDHLRQWARRHPSLLAAGAVVMVLLTAGSLISTALIRVEQARTRAEQQKAEAAYQRERQRAEEAEQRFRLARRSVDELIQVSEEELADRPGMEGVRKRLLRSALAYYQEFVEQRRGDPDAQAELIDTTTRVEKILSDLAVLRAASKLYLLCQPAVLDDLRLDGTQRAKMKDVTARVGKQWFDSLADIGKLSPAERGRRMLAQARANESEVNAILTAAQQGRLKQIGLQSEGPGAFREPEVASALALTAAQRERIRTIEDETLYGWMRPVTPGKEPDVKGLPAGERILEVLTAEQSKRWREMSGEPVKGPLMPFAPVPFGPWRGAKGPTR